MRTEIKISLFVFLFFFISLFFIFNGSAFPAQFHYKTQQIIFSFQKELFRSPKFITKIPKNEEKKPSFLLLNNLHFSEFIELETQNTITPEVPPDALETNLIELPQFDIKAPIITTTNPDADFIYKELFKGVVLYPGSSVPGQGYSIILGHSSQYPWEKGNYKSVFSLLNELKNGEQIYIFWEQKPLIFEVQDKKIFVPWPKGTETTETIFPPNNEEKILILQSCWPVGIASKRVAIKTVLVR